MVEHEQAVAVLDGVAEVVGDHEGGELFLLHHLAGEDHDGLCRLGVQGGGVLVQDEEVQRRHGRHEQRHGLPLAAGEGAHFHVELILQAQAQRGQLRAVEVDALAVDPKAQAKALALVVRQGHVFQHGQVGAGPQGGVLIHPADGGVALKVLLLADALAAHQHVAPVQGDGAAEDVQQRGLAGAVAAHDGDELAVVHGEVEVVEQGHFRHGAGVVDFR